MVSCRDLVRLAASGELEETGLVRRALLRLHLLMCRHCSRYCRQVRAIGVGAREFMDTRAAEVETPRRLEAELLARLRGGEGPRRRR